CVLRPFRSRRRLDDLPDAELPGVVMVVAAYNEADVIADKVANFLSIDYPDERLRLLIGSDGSDDGTAGAALAAAAGSGRVEVREFSERRGKVNVLNELVPSVDAPVVLFSDANTMYDAPAVRKLVRHFADAKTGGVCGRLVLLASGGDPADAERLYWAYENRIKTLEGRSGDLTSINGQVFAIRRELFETMPPDSLTEDEFLGLKIISRGFRIYYEPEALVTETAGALKDEMNRRLRISAGNFQTLFRIGLRILNPLNGFPAFAYLSHKVLRWLIPFGMLAAFIGNAFVLRLPLFAGLMAAQVLFYGAAAIGAASAAAGRLPPVRIARYFVLMNAMIACGFFKYLGGVKGASWQTRGRNKNTHPEH
ncbi:MAG TPA: glycosyltransferase, partial [Planctomycetes bacterium]|nr:glycosyltransferase [Planctomycetota bacterium]